MRALASMFRHIARDRRGTSIIELALALPLLSIMLVGLVDLASCFSAQLTIQQAAARSLERVQVKTTTLNTASIRTEAATAAGVPESQIAVETWLECDNVKMPAATTTCDGTQDAGKYVKVTINSNYVPFFTYSPLGTRQANGSVALSAAASVRYS